MARFEGKGAVTAALSSLTSAVVTAKNARNLLTRAGLVAEAVDAEYHRLKLVELAGKVRAKLDKMEERDDEGTNRGPQEGRASTHPGP
jgi:ERCC4-type nuclease